MGVSSLWELVAGGVGQGLMSIYEAGGWGAYSRARAENWRDQNTEPGVRHADRNLGSGV